MLVADESFSDPTSPSECAVLVAPPLSREAFLEDVAMAQKTVPASRSRGDYALQLASKPQYQGDIDQAWLTDGAVVAQLCKEVITDAKAAGVRTYEAATTHCIVDAVANGARVVIIIAHWKGSRVKASDIRIKAIATIASTASTCVFGATIRSRLFELLERKAGSLRAAEIADELSKAVCSAAGYPIESGSFVDLDSYMNDPGRAGKIGAARDQLDALFPDLLVPGNCLELRDGLHKQNTISKLFVQEWSGIVELCVCFSMELALAIKNGRQDRRLITNERAKDPERCLPELQETIVRLSSCRENYAVLRAKVFRQYSSML